MLRAKKSEKSETFVKKTLLSLYSYATIIYEMRGKNAEPAKETRYKK